MKKGFLLSKLNRLPSQYKKGDHEDNKVLYRAGIGFSHWMAFLEKII
jgi:hypothetical protein